MELFFNIKSLYIFKEQKELDLDYKSPDIEKEVAKNYNQSEIKHLLKLLDENNNLILSIEKKSLENINSVFQNKFKDFSANYLLFDEIIEQKEKNIMLENNETIFEIENKFKVSFNYLKEVEMLKIIVEDLNEEEKYKFDLETSEIERVLDFTLNEIKKLILRKNGKKFQIK